MLNWIWNALKGWQISRKWKYFCFVTLVTLIWALGGLIVWLFVNQLIEVNKVQWLICVIGYAGLVGFFRGLVFVFNHE